MGLPIAWLALIGIGRADDSAENWSQFRGPASAHASGHRPPMQWSDSQNIQWQVPIAGLGWSSPSIHRGVIYMTTAVPKGEGLSLRAMALDANSGKTLWDTEVKSVDTMQKTAMRALRRLCETMHSTFILER